MSTRKIHSIVTLQCHVKGSIGVCNHGGKGTWRRTGVQNRQASETSKHGAACGTKLAEIGRKDTNNILCQFQIHIFRIESHFVSQLHAVQIRMLTPNWLIPVQVLCRSYFIFQDPVTGACLISADTLNMIFTTIRESVNPRRAWVDSSFMLVFLETVGALQNKLGLFPSGFLSFRWFLSFQVTTCLLHKVPTTSLFTRLTTEKVWNKKK